MNYLIGIVVALGFQLASAEVISAEVFEKDASDYKVLVFLSKNCPCSRSHIAHLSALSQQYKSAPIYGVMTDDLSDETVKKETFDYYLGAEFKFPIVQVGAMDLVKHYRALKTPHVSILKKSAKAKYEIVYEGGVTNEHRFENATVKYLEDNLVALQKNTTLKHKNGRSLGCYIRRI